MNATISRFILAAAITILLVAAGVQPVLAQSPSFSDFTSTANLTLNGDAAPANNGSANVLRLTPAIAAKRGSAWFNVQQPVSGGFTTVFTFQFTQGSLPPADGIAFVIQNSALSALGQTGGSIGYADGATCDGETCVNSGGGIPNSLAVEFDTFDNGAATDDPNANHIGIQSCGIVGGVPQPNSPAHGENSVGFPICNLAGPVTPVPTMSDGSVYTVTIDYEPPSCIGDCGPGLMTVKLGNTTVLTSELTLEDSMNLNSGKAWVGLTSATGSAFENHDILSWTFTPHNPDSITKATPPGQTTVFNFGAFNFKSTPDTTTVNGNSLTVTPTPLPANSDIPFAAGNAKCITYANTGGTCWTFTVVCTGPDCGGTYDAEFSTSYDSDTTILKPGFGKGEFSCAVPFTGIFKNQIDGFFVQRIDPTTKGRSGGSGSCWVATQNTPGVSDLVSNFIGFNSPVQNNAVNVVKAGQAIPLGWQLLDENSHPITNLTLCTTTTGCAPGTVSIVFFASSTCSADDDVADISGTLADMAGNSGLQNMGNGNYQYVWKTPNGLKGCYLARVTFSDGILHDALFKFK